MAASRVGHPARPNSFAVGGARLHCSRTPKNIDAHGAELHTVNATTHTEAQAARWKSAGGVGIEAFKLDITRSEDRVRAGERQIDVLVNNAAVG